MYHRASGPWTITGSLNIDSEPVCLTTLAIYTKNSPYLIHKKDLERRNARWPKLHNFKTKTYITSQYAQLSNKQTLIWIKTKAWGCCVPCRNCWDSLLMILWFGSIVLRCIASISSMCKFSSIPIAGMPRFTTTKSFWTSCHEAYN
jgi:hypothetical protein